MALPNFVTLACVLSADTSPSTEPAELSPVPASFSGEDSSSLRVRTPFVRMVMVDEDLLLRAGDDGRPCVASSPVSESPSPSGSRASSDRRASAIVLVSAVAISRKGEDARDES